MLSAYSCAESMQVVELLYPEQDFFPKAPPSAAPFCSVLSHQFSKDAGTNGVTACLDEIHTTMRD